MCLLGGLDGITVSGEIFPSDHSINTSFPRRRRSSLKGMDGDLITGGWKRLKPTWIGMSVVFLGKLLQRPNKLGTMQLNTKTDYMNGLCVAIGGSKEEREQQFDEET